MKFKDLKAGYPIYILDKTNLTFVTEKVQNITMPHIDAKMTATQMVVDITTPSGTYCAIAESEIAYPASKVLATDRSSILREVEMIKATSEQALSQVESHKQAVTKCNQLIAELDPAQRDKQAMEARMQTIETSMSQMMDMLKKLTE